MTDVIDAQPVRMRRRRRRNFNNPFANSSACQAPSKYSSPEYGKPIEREVRRGAIRRARPNAEARAPPRAAVESARTPRLRGHAARGITPIARAMKSRGERTTAPHVRALRRHGFAAARRRARPSLDLVSTLLWRTPVGHERQTSAPRRFAIRRWSRSSTASEAWGLGRGARPRSRCGRFRVLVWGSVPRGGARRAARRRASAESQRAAEADSSRRLLAAVRRRGSSCKAFSIVARRRACGARGWAAFSTRCCRLTPQSQPGSRRDRRQARSSAYAGEARVGASARDRSSMAAV